ncbi:hypothetical protein [Micromonospora ureilytica]|uniref:hypothetical protein n=1 Tax=Micromonospora ureilytica TaxID=709868 RepID=UPI001F0C733C|nr:hypothetical protein [Micromonospora ureilytica]
MTLLDHVPSEAQLRRSAYRRRQTVYSVLVAAFSTAALGTLLVIAVTGAPGWERVRRSFLDPEIARDALPTVLSGLWLNWISEESWPFRAGRNRVRDRDVSVP